MNSNLHCVAIYDGEGYYAQWMIGDLILFSAEAKETFNLDYELEKRSMEKLLLLHGNEKIFETNASIAMLQCETNVFCPIEEFEPLFDKLLVILKELGEPSRYSGSYEQRLNDRRSRTMWKNKWSLVTRVVNERRRRELIEKLDDCTTILALDPNAKEFLKGKRVDLSEVVDVLLKRIAPPPVPIVQSTPQPALEISFGMPLPPAKKKSLLVKRPVPYQEEEDLNPPGEEP